MIGVHASAGASCDYIQREACPMVKQDASRGTETDRTLSKTERIARTPEQEAEGRFGEEIQSMIWDDGQAFPKSNSKNLEWGEILRPRAKP